ncbi:hypothetical protein ACET3X_001886 [Alternaria dauci]|uniref:Uncharacterized protein n=1 Tax=Alternaria dauci TaxID=48095 RepID=A0ABR3V0E5_9PLEO
MWAARALQQRLDQYRTRNRIRKQVLVEDEYRIRNELRQIELRRSLLEAELDTNLTQQRRVDPEAEGLIQEMTAIDRSRCRPSCEAMQQYLPRELRDMIYKHIVGPTEWHNNHHTVPVLGRKHDNLPEVVFAVSVGSFWHIFECQDYMGDRMRRELVECWYKTCTFDFATDVHLINGFLKGEAALSESLTLGRPALDLVRHLEITLPCAGLRDEASSESTFAPILQGAALLKRPARLRINLDSCFRTSGPDAHHLARIFHQLSQLLPSLIGWKVEFVVAVWTDEQESAHTFGPGSPTIVEGYRVNLLLPGMAESSHSQWVNVFQQVGSEATQLYYTTLNEPSEQDSDYEPDDGCSTSEDGTENHSDDDYWND